ncbi:hypothetical protein TPHA_0F02190 [Tetrapisispora phaffii CBS 4417]|uniref:Ribosome assembly protein 1 n=1 Tax=Tetrapisispora phaffii (strain ATCC 24235 / CBS 4417 / NBRC 1672 / NRRL Y-8282 / UCD 70-5) TaxID=1071381 RepID=G8BVB9_TETPH|nr:hypothetical protein TPHA_0F02190 [Tetrapisispora phaffii CBS 4417]CCE63701.1 hypothetical protein TPHA_0F02190 [Tetrapisispora phaffii CBS 4417]
MVKISPDTFKRLQNDPSCIRNICIVAHVDHGKTSLSDSLLASNGIISQRLAGKVRFLDSRPDEQLRGITMESSAISLYFRVLHKQENSDKPLVNEHLINLIDSPGHIDFSSEVSAASRLCDGAVVLVDVVEGVCSQTITVLRQCWTEKLKPVLVLNKIDRLITELQLSSQEAYLHLTKVIEQVNSVLGSFFIGQQQLDDFSWKEQLEDDANTAFKDSDDSELYFDPAKNNVVFASAVDGWGFNIGQLAKFYEVKLGAKRENLQKVLWGDFYMDPNEKILNNKTLKGRSLKPLFVSLILDNIWKVYENTVIERNMEVVEKITKALNITLQSRDLMSKDDKILLRTILGQWLPVSTAILITVIEKLPSPLLSQEDRLDTILGANIDQEEVDATLLEGMKKCDRNGPSIAYVSKILSIPREELPMKASDNSPEAILERGRRAREMAMRAAKRAELLEKTSNLHISDSDNTLKIKDSDLYERAVETATTPSTDEIQKTVTGQKKTANDSFSIVTEAAPALDLGFEYEEENVEHENENSEDDFVPDFEPPVIDPNDPLASMFEYEEEEDPFEISENNEINVALEEEDEEEDLFDEVDEVLVGFARIYSGSLRVGQSISVLGPKYNPKCPTEHIHSAEITDLYLFMGKELVPLDVCPAGNIVGVGGLAGKLLKNGTLVDNSIPGINLAGVNLQIQPIVKVAVEPKNPMQLNKLVRGLKLLELADPCVQTYLESSGEHILCTAGELHLERCIKDLQERFAGIEIACSEPAIPYRETFISDSNTNPVKNANFERGTVEKAIGPYKLRLRSVPMNNDAVKYIENNADIIKDFLTTDYIQNHEGETKLTKQDFITKLKSILKSGNSEIDIWDNLESEIVLFGPKRIGNNILMSKNNLLNSPFLITDGAFEFSDSVINGFQNSVNEGPLANEVVQGMCVIIEDIYKMSDEEIASIEDPTYQKENVDLSGRLINVTRDTIHTSFLDWSARLMWAMYSCDIQTSVEVLGKVYAVVQQRRGKIVSEELKEGTPFFQIEAHIPVVNAFGFSEDIRKKTSGAAQPQLVFLGYESIDIDPFWVPTTEKELEELGDTADKENLARKHMIQIRKRKGLFVDEKVITNAEKQRTLKRN